MGHIYVIFKNRRHVIHESCSNILLPELPLAMLELISDTADRIGESMQRNTSQIRSLRESLKSDSETMRTSDLFSGLDKNLEEMQR